MGSGDAASLHACEDTVNEYNFDESQSRTCSSSSQDVLPQNDVTEKRAPRSPTPPPAACIEVTAVAAMVSSSAHREVEHLRQQQARLSEQVSLWVVPRHVSPM